MKDSTQLISGQERHDRINRSQSRIPLRSMSTEQFTAHVNQSFNTDIHANEDDNVGSGDDYRPSAVTGLNEYFSENHISHSKNQAIFNDIWLKLVRQ